jgi:hypothetical protein
MTVSLIPKTAQPDTAPRCVHCNLTKANHVGTPRSSHDFVAPTPTLDLGSRLSSLR